MTATDQTCFDLVAATGRLWMLGNIRSLPGICRADASHDSRPNVSPPTDIRQVAKSLTPRKRHSKHGKSQKIRIKRQLSNIFKSVAASYKPSPLGYGSPPTRTSPFRRPESPASPSPLRYTTPTNSPTKVASGTGALRLTPGRQSSDFLVASSQMSFRAAQRDTPQALSSSSALSQLQPAQVRTLRDGFQILDRDCDGVVNREDIADMLSQLGLPNSASDVSQFFPPSKPQTITLAAFLNSLAETLCEMSPSPELLSAFSAFDNDDSGQVDLAELRDSLLNTAPEAGEKALTATEVDRVINGFTGRRAFNRNINAQLGGKKGEVFKYNEFVASIMGSNGAAEGSLNDHSE
ncbi:hypothetical protein E4U58_002022 [Claviceps cyperi]|nr:hypothetical protein E4U58_002022 [Claviceps cyperi]